VVNKDARTKADSSRSSSKDRKARGSSVKKAAASARRTWIVLTGLAGGLAFTGALLKALAPPPLTPDATASLFAVNQEQSIDQLFDTPVTVGSDRWHAIYVHQSLSASGDAQSLGARAGGLADHFIIGNGDALPDGAVQTGARWSRQLPAGAVPGVQIRPDCVSICVVGDFNRSRPTATQEARLLELIAALQRKLGIDADQVVLGWQADQTSIAGVGNRFPLAALRSQLPQ
jgi:hypothetical protein